MDIWKGPTVRLLDMGKCGYGASQKKGFFFFSICTVVLSFRLNEEKLCWESGNPSNFALSGE